MPWEKGGLRVLVKNAESRKILLFSESQEGERMTDKRFLHAFHNHDHHAVVRRADDQREGRCRSWRESQRPAVRGMAIITPSYTLHSVFACPESMFRKSGSTIHSRSRRGISSSLANVFARDNNSKRKEKRINEFHSIHTDNRSSKLLTCRGNSKRDEKKVQWRLFFIKRSQGEEKCTSIMLLRKEMKEFALKSEFAIVLR